jgi:glutamate synthase (NADPH/NADH) large chain
MNPELVELIDMSEITIHHEHLRGMINQHWDETGSSRAQEILNNFEAYLPKFKLVKPKSADIKALLGHRSRSEAELIVEAQ